MLEQLSAIASKRVESISEFLNETTVKNVKEPSPLQASMEIIDSTSLESLKTQNEIQFLKLPESSHDKLSDATQGVWESAEKQSEQREVQYKEIQEAKEDYVNDIVENSEVPETIDVREATSADYKKCSTEETATKRDEFNQQKNELIKQWEQENGQKWPTYKEDIYSANGHRIRCAGDKYDAHHIQPLSMGGKNETNNITPLHAECHYDRQGVHAPDSAYAKLEQKLGA